jgi:hypothetical protein
VRYSADKQNTAQAADQIRTTRSSGVRAGARHGVAGGRWVAVDVDGKARVVARVRGHRNLGRVAGATASDGDLGARNVPLRGTVNVETDLLDTDEVLEEKCQGLIEEIKGRNSRHR